MGLEPSNSREGSGFLGIYKALFIWGPDMEVEPGNSYIPINVRKTTPRGMQKKTTFARGTFAVAPQSASSFLVFSSCQLRWAEIYKMVDTTRLSGWCFFTNPSEKYARQIGSFPQIGMNKKLFETTN